MAASVVTERRRARNPARGGRTPRRPLHDGVPAGPARACCRLARSAGRGGSTRPISTLVRAGHPTTGRAVGGAPPASPPTPRAVGRATAPADWSCGDIAGSWQVVEAAMASGRRAADIYVEVLGPALHAIGRLWQRVPGDRAGAPRQRRRRGDRRPDGPPLPPTRASAWDRAGRDAGRRATWTRRGHAGRHPSRRRVLGLEPGSRHTARSLVAAMRDADDFSAVIVSVVDSSHLAAAADLVSAARQCDESVVVIAGGFAVPDERVARSIGADGWSRDPRRLGELIDALKAGR